MLRDAVAANNRADSLFGETAASIGVRNAGFLRSSGEVYAVFERATADHERFGKRFGVTFDDALPEWRREQKLDDWGRTYWRLKLTD